MAYRSKDSQKSDAITVGKVGEFEVKKVDEKSVPCLIIGRDWFSPRKARQIVENLDTVKEFLKRFDTDAKPAAPKEVIKENEALKAQLAALNAQLAMSRNGRFDPATAQLAAAA